MNTKGRLVKKKDDEGTKHGTRWDEASWVMRAYTTRIIALGDSLTRM